MIPELQEVLKVIFQGGDTEAFNSRQRMMYIAINLFEGDAAHHEMWWKEQLLDCLGIERDELCKALYGWNEDNWPDKGIAP